MATYLIGNVKGPKGEDGYSPSARVDQTSTGAIITVQDENGVTTAEIRNGIDSDGNNIDLTPYATKVEVEEDIDALADVYATIDYVDGEIADVSAPVTSVNGMVGDVVIQVPTLDGYATQAWVESQDYLTTAPVASVNGETGAVVLDASDVGALPDNTVIPTATSDLTNDSGFLNATTLAPYLAQKQDTLTAGSNITISNNVISASTGTTYTAGTGIQINNGVISSTVTDTNTTYTAGNGLSLSGTEFSVDSSVVALQTDIPDVSGFAESANLATVATTGSYTDLSNTPTIPTATSDLTNDSGFITSSDLPADELPDYSLASEGDVLTVDSNGDLEWSAPAASGITEEDLKGSVTIESDHDAGEDYSILSLGLDENGIVYAEYDSSDRMTLSRGLDAVDIFEYDDNEDTKTQTSFSYSADEGLYFHKTVFDTSQDPEDLTDEYAITLKPNSDYDGLEFETGGNTYTIATTSDIPANELPALTNNGGKVLKVNSGATAVEWANESTELPSIGSSDAGKVLTVNSSHTGVE